MMYSYCGDWAGGTMFGGIIMILFWIAIISLIVWIVRKALHWHQDGERDNAIEILKERYARGEINKEEFEAKKKDLMMM